MARLGDEERFALLDLEADGTALKLERFLWTLPRLREIQDHDAPTNAATPALRSNGFTVVRVGEAPEHARTGLGRQHELEQALGQGQPPPLSTEDVTRGLRVEVWDDTAKRWQSLHSRLTTMQRGRRRRRCSTTRPRKASSRGRPPHETREASRTRRSTSTRQCSAGRAGACRRRGRAGACGTRTATRSSRTCPESDPDPVHPILVDESRSTRARCRACASAARTPCAPGRSTSPATPGRTS